MPSQLIPRTSCLMHYPWLASCAAVVALHALGSGFNGYFTFFNSSQADSPPPALAAHRYSGVSLPTGCFYLFFSPAMGAACDAGADMPSIGSCYLSHFVPSFLNFPHELEAANDASKLAQWHSDALASVCAYRDGESWTSMLGAALCFATVIGALLVRMFSTGALRRASALAVAKTMAVILLHVLIIATATSPFIVGSRPWTAVPLIHNLRWLHAVVAIAATMQHLTQLNAMKMLRLNALAGRAAGGAAGGGGEEQQWTGDSAGVTLEGEGAGLRGSSSGTHRLHPSGASGASSPQPLDGRAGSTAFDAAPTQPVAPPVVTDTAPIGMATALLSTCLIMATRYLSLRTNTWLFVLTIAAQLVIQRHVVMKFASIIPSASAGALNRHLRHQQGVVVEQMDPQSPTEASSIASSPSSQGGAGRRPRIYSDTLSPDEVSPILSPSAGVKEHLAALRCSVEQRGRATDVFRVCFDTLVIVRLGFETLQSLPFLGSVDHFYVMFFVTAAFMIQEAGHDCLTLSTALFTTAISADEELRLMDALAAVGSRLDAEGMKTELASQKAELALQRAETEAQKAQLAAQKAEAEAQSSAARRQLLAWIMHEVRGPSNIMKLGLEELQRQVGGADEIVRAALGSSADGMADRSSSPAITAAVERYRCSSSSSSGASIMSSSRSSGSVAARDLAPLLMGTAETLSVLGTSLSAIATVVDSSLQLSAIEAGSFTHKPVPADLHAVLSEVVGSIQPLALSLHVTLVLQWDPLLPTGRSLSFDPDRIGQVARNFLSNALKFVPHDGRGRVELKVERAEAPPSTRAAGAAGAAEAATAADAPSPQAEAGPAQSDQTVQWVRIACVDNGGGIPPDDVPLLFQPYRQVRSGSNEVDEMGQRSAGGSTTSTTAAATTARGKRKQGTGLGLAISRAIVEQHGGSVKASSELGRGSTFQCLLPLQEVAAAQGSGDDSARGAAASHRTGLASGESSPLTAPAAAPLPSTASFRVLLVDDCSVSRKLLSRALQRSFPNCTVDQAEDGAEAVEMVRRSVGLPCVCPSASGEESRDSGQTGSSSGGAAANTIHRYSAVLMDGLMPGMDGYDAAAAIRALPSPLTDPPSLLIAGVTGNALPEDQERFKRAGADAVLVKPVNLPEIKTLLERSGCCI